MGKGSFAVLLLIIFAVLAIVIFMRGVEEGEEGVKELGLSLILVCFVFFFALYLGRLRTREFISLPKGSSWKLTLVIKLSHIKNCR